ncbi:uncharacterized protein LOC100159210 [Acyrthosiphon pisum]|uniref:Uncharacterized protein n=1 Tax=Acyrthosiphon pisum TaxID=7029 RepID=A0A8R1W5C9_ACYPI|nr:uncharacterized protein LOC100159210 [Acyrthosiphon pisum]|eukprot:XP_001949843.1 PREDICTED: uncharacterized protein LOC100159210 [Acyrthosiphon pisum]
MNRLHSVSVCVVVILALGVGRSKAFCGLRSGDSEERGNVDDFITCLKAKAIVTLDRMSRDDSLPLTGSVTLVHGDSTHRRQRSDQGPEVSELELQSKPDDALNNMLYDKAVRLLSGRVVKVGLPEVTPDQLRTALEEGRGKMKKTMGMMMTMGAMKAMMIIPLALGVLFLLAGKALIISKIALVLSLIITLKKLLSKSGGGGGGSEHMMHESHSSGWPSGGSSGGHGGGWDKRSASSEAAAAASQMLAYRSYIKP